jgi:hypothetical protein
MMRRLSSVIFFVLVAFVSATAFATPALAQTAPKSHPGPIGVGEKYWVEFTVAWWQPTATGEVASDRLDLIGSRVDFVGDLALQGAAHGDLKLVLHPARKHKLRFQYSPVGTSGDSVLSRDIVFKGQTYPVSLPVQSTVNWTVMRLGYEWDFLYTPRGFFGALVEVRQTHLDASLNSFIASGEITGDGPVPSFGVAGRVYATRRLSINGDASAGFLSDFTGTHDLKSLDIDVSATYNFARTVGVTGGWRVMNTNLILDNDRGDLNFRGLWIGGVVRY